MASNECGRAEKSKQCHGYFLQYSYLHLLPKVRRFQTKMHCGYIAQKHITISPVDNKKLRRGITSQFTLKGAEIQMSTLDPYQYSSNTTILCIWAWERCRPSLWKWLQKNEKQKRYLIDVKFSTDKKLATGQDRQRKAIFSVMDPTFGCFY